MERVLQCADLRSCVLAVLRFDAIPSIPCIPSNSEHGTYPPQTVQQLKTLCPATIALASQVALCESVGAGGRQAWAALWNNRDLPRGATSPADRHPDTCGLIPNGSSRVQSLGCRASGCRRAQPTFAGRVTSPRPVFPPPPLFSRTRTTKCRQADRVQYEQSLLLWSIRHASPYPLGRTATPYPRHRTASHHAPCVPATHGLPGRRRVPRPRSARRRGHRAGSHRGGSGAAGQHGSPA